MKSDPNRCQIRQFCIEFLSVIQISTVFWLRAYYKIFNLIGNARSSTLQVYYYAKVYNLDSRHKSRVLILHNNTLQACSITIRYLPMHATERMTEVHFVISSQVKSSRECSELTKKLKKDEDFTDADIAGTGSTQRHLQKYNNTKVGHFFAPSLNFRQIAFSAASLGFLRCTHSRMDCQGLRKVYWTVIKWVGGKQSMGTKPLLGSSLKIGWFISA